MTYRHLVRTAALAAVLATALAPVAHSEILEQVLVKINGEIFTKTDLETRQVTEIRQRGKQIDLSTPQGNEELRKTIAEVTPVLLVNVIDEMLIVQRAEVFGRVAVTDDEAHKYYDTHMTEFTTPSSVMLREILINVPADARG